MVNHHPNYRPKVTLYYTILRNSNSLINTQEGWEKIEPKLYDSGQRECVGIERAGLSTFRTALQKPTSGMKIVFYLDVSDERGNTLLTCNPKKRWDSSFQQDKYTIIIDK